MKIRKIHIQSFGGLTNRQFAFDENLTVVEGPNESGKTTIAAFIKYIFYGIGARNTADRKRYLTGTSVGGWLECITDAGILYRIERVTRIENETETVRDSVRIIDRQTNRILPETKPGEYFFGIAENIFTNTAFIGQIAGTRPDGATLAGAVENMLHSGDENVNLKKAAEKLNQARREILPKNSTGGLLREKQEEKTALEQALEETDRRNEKLAEAEAALAEARKKENDLARKKDQYALSSDAVEVVDICKKIIMLEDAGKKLEGYQNTLDVLSAPPYSDLPEKLQKYQQDFDDTVTGEKNHPSQLLMPDENAAAAMEEGEYLESKARLMLAVSVIMLIAGIAALAAAAIMIYFAYPLRQFAIPLAVMVVFAIVGIVCYILQNRTLRLLDELLDEWQVDSLDELDQRMAQGVVSPAEPAEDQDHDILSLAQACGVPVEEDRGATLAALLKKSEKVQADRELVKSKVENLKGRVALLQEQLKGVDKKDAADRYRALASTPAGKEILRMNPEAMARMEKEKAFADSAWQAQCKKVAALEQTCASLAAPEGKAPDILASQLARVEEELDMLQKRHDGYTMAYEALLQAGETVRSDVIPEVTRQASAYMNHATGGKYGEVAMDPSFGMMYTKDDRSDNVEFLSKGTADLAYISLRMALAHTLFWENRHEIPPLLFDESFAAVDNTRLSGAMDAILSSDLQCILFTCRQDEAAIAQKKNCTVISLP